MKWAIIAIILAVIFIGFAKTISIYNNLVKAKNKVKNSWAHIDAQLQRRLDLVPNLVNIVKGFMAHDESWLEDVENSKRKYMTSQTHSEKLKANAALSLQLRTLYIMTEQFPSLQNDLNFLKLQTELTEIEEDITFARQFYNDAVTIYNNQIMPFPNNIIASAFGFKEAELFDATKEAETAPQVQFKLHRKTKCPNCGAEVGYGQKCEYCGYFLS